MPKTRKINRHGKTRPPKQGDFKRGSPVMPQTSGKPTSKEAPHSTMRNRSMKAPGSGTRGSGRGVR